MGARSAWLGSAVRVKAALVWMAVALAGCASAPRTLEPPEVQIVGLALMRASADEQRFRVSLRLDNPNPEAIPVQALEFRVRLAGAGLLDGRSAAPFTLPALGSQTLRLEVSTELLSSVSRLLAVVQGPEDALSYELDGELQTARRFRPALPFHFRGRVPLTATMGGL
jgi:LEA14-like dessication related protein